MSGKTEVYEVAEWLGVLDSEYSGLMELNSVHRYESGTLSMEAAAELSGLSLWDFIDMLEKYNVPWMMEYTEGEWI